MKITYSAEAHDAIWKASVRPECADHVSAILGEHPRMEELRQLERDGLIRLRWTR